jgi:hypothetical protein
MHRFLPAFLGIAALVAIPAAPAAAQDKTSPNMSLVDNVPYEQFDNRPKNYGTDIEFMQRGNKRYAVGGSYYNGMHIVDISRGGRNRQVVGRYDCAILQGDVQIFKAADGSKRTLATYTADAATTETDSQCFKDAEAKGFDAIADDGRGRQGTFIVDLTNPKQPKTVSFVEVPQGSHNMTVHPGGGWLYNSNSDLMTSTSPAIEIIDIRNPSKPKKTGELALTPLPGLGTESHDITFSDNGKRAYSAALSHGVVIDTTNPGKPAILTEFDDESINVWHQSDPVSIDTPEGRKTFLIAEDEFAGAAGGPVCPSGGVHVYDITGEKEKAPEKVGYWNIDDFGPTHDPEGTCTAHVFDIHERQQLMTMAFYNGGVRVIDLAGLATGEGLKAIGSYQAADADTWSFKAPTVSRTGVWYGYGNDIARGMDVYRYDGRRPQASNVGTWIPGPALDAGAASGAAQQATTTASGGIVQVAAGAARATTSTTTARAASTSAGSLRGYRMSCLLVSQKK